MTEKMIIDAYCRIRTIDNTIPDDVLDFMKDAAIEKLNSDDTLSDEHIRVVARKKALKYSYANEFQYEKYVDAIIEGARFSKNFLKKSTLLFIVSLTLFSCQDTQSFENVRKLRKGMTINQAELFIGNPQTYKYIDDSTELRTYKYDNPGNGMDMDFKIYYVNEKINTISNGY
jgi:hypothetical protein